MSAPSSKSVISLILLTFGILIGVRLLSVPVFAVLQFALDLVHVSRKTQDDIRIAAALVSFVIGGLAGAFLASLLTALIRKDATSRRPAPDSPDNAAQPPARLTTKIDRARATLNSLLVLSVVTFAGGVVGIGVGMQVIPKIGRGETTQQVVTLMTLVIGASLGGLVASIATARMRRVAGANEHQRPVQQPSSPWDEPPS